MKKGMNIIISYKKAFENWLSASFRGIIALFIILCIGLIYWYFRTGRSFSDLIIFFTLITIIIYTYYTYQIAKSTYYGPTLLEVQKDHSRILRNFLEYWLGVIKPLPHYENINIRTGDRPESVWDDFANIIVEYKHLEEKWEYRDLIDYHLPNGFSDLEDYWNNFKATVVKLKSKRDELYKSISDDIDNKLEGMKQEHGNIILGRDSYLDSLKGQVYRLCVSADTSDRKINFNVGIQPQTNYYLLQNSNTNEVILTNGTREQMEQAKNELETIVNHDYTTKKYATLIKMIREYDKEMKLKRDNLQSKFGDLIGWTSILPGTSCDRLRDLR